MQLSLRRLSKGTDLVAVGSDPALPAVLEFQSPSSAVLAEPVPRTARGTIWVISSMLAAMVLVAAVVKVDKVVTGQATVVSKSPVLTVQPLDQSIVRTIDVQVGQRVRAGQVLARLDPTFATADLGALTEQVASLEAQVSRLQAQAEGKPFKYTGTNPELSLQAAIYAQMQAQYNYQVEEYRQKINSLVQTIKQANYDAAQFRSRLAIAKDVEKMRRDLEKAYVGSKLNTLAAMDSTTEMERQLLDATQTAAQNEKTLEAQIADRDAFIQQWAANITQTLAQTNDQLEQAREQLNKAQLHRQMVELRADQDSIVLAVAKGVAPGTVMQSGQPLFTLMPADSKLEVEADVQGAEAGYMKVGDPVVIKFQTFTFTRYGMAHGKIRVITNQSFTGVDNSQPALQGSVPISPGDTTPYYRAIISIDSVKLKGVPAGFQIVPGMPLEADINVGKETVLDYIFDRVFPTLADAFREPN